ncbi:MAG: aspartate kinase [Defluviitaleaceae bacterium]|nr:aspartate kinase [Defluviitaleaceae bacterium]
MLIVQKYGGTSVADYEKIFCAADKIAQDYLKNHNMVIVLSAQGNTTDILLEKAGEISNNPSKRELDALLATGEQQSAALMAMALVEKGLPAISLNARQAGIFSTSEHGCAKIISINPDRIKAEIENRKIVVITGFQGVDEYGEITTLGRGASDTTAIALAAALSADLCEIYTDVEGIFTADPRITKDAFKYKEIAYDEILELSSMGASVLHSRSVELAKKFGVEFSVKSSTVAAEPTIIKDITSIEKKSVSGITADRKICKISINEIKAENVPEIIHLLSKNKISLDIITHSAGDKFDSLSFAISGADSYKAMELLSIYNIQVNENLAKLSVIGPGIAYETHIAAIFYETLLEEEVKIHLLSLSAIKISALINREEVTNIILALHKKFMEAGILSPQISWKEDNA